MWLVVKAHFGWRAHRRRLGQGCRAGAPLSSLGAEHMIDLVPSVNGLWNRKDPGLDMGKALPFSEPQLSWPVKWGS